MTRPLVVLAHGTADGRGREVLEQVTQDAAAQLDQPARLGYVDVCAPTAQDVLAGLTAPVVVPLFLASGYHVRTDIPAAVGAVPGAVATSAVGSGPGVVAAVAGRVLALEPTPDSVILTGAGSSSADARAEIADAARLLADRLRLPVRHAFLSASSPTVAEAYSGLEGRVVLASHLLAPGHFQGRLEKVAADLGLSTTEPIGAHPNIAAAIVARYRETAQDGPHD